MNKLPKITISSVDADRLERLLNSLKYDFPGIDELQAELDRADILAPEKMPDNVVTMNSKVTFREEFSAKEFSLTLVYPKDKGESEDTISVLAPVGSAMLGLTEGDQISWPKPGGGILSLRIIKVAYQPERDGQFHR